MVSLPRFPLRADFFPECEISVEAEAKMIRLADTTLAKLSSNCSWWTPLKQKHGVQLSEERVGEHLYSVRAVTRLAATLDEAMEVLLSEDTLTFKQQMRQFYKNYFLDGSVLYASSRCEMNESFSIKWLGLKACNPLAWDKDFCFLDYTKRKVYHNEGEETQAVVRVLESVTLPACRSLQSSHKLERGYISRCAYIIRDIGNGFLSAEFVCSLDQTADSSNSLRHNRIQLQKMALALCRLQEMITTLRISNCLFVQPDHWIKDNERHACSLCRRTFGPLRRRHHCRLCGEVICSRCCIFTEVILPVLGLIQIRICKTCVVSSQVYIQHAVALEYSQEYVKLQIN